MSVKSFFLAAVAMPLWAGAVTAQDLRFEFTIDAQISGSRPWDGTASSSAAADSLGVGKVIFGDGFLGRMADTAIDGSLDEVQATIAPPDPYLCIIEIRGGLPSSFASGATTASDQYSAVCTPHEAINRNSTHFSLDLPSDIARMPVFGVALVDSDLEDNPSQVQSQNDELIGFGLFVSEDVRAQIGARDPLTLEVIDIYLAELPKVVDALFGLGRGQLSSPTHLLEMERLSYSNCKQSCRFGDASLTIKNSVGGW